MTTCITTEDCKNLFAAHAQRNVLRVAHVRRSVPTLSAEAVAAALETLTVQEPSRFKPSFMVSLTLPDRRGNEDADGTTASEAVTAPSFVTVRVDGRDAVESATEKAAARLGLPQGAPLPPDAIVSVHLDSITAIDNDDDDDNANTAVGKAAAATTGIISVADLVPSGPAHLRLRAKASATPRETMYRTYTRLEMASSGDLSPDQSSVSARSPVMPVTAASKKSTSSSTGAFATSPVVVTKQPISSASNDVAKALAMDPVSPVAPKMVKPDPPIPAPVLIDEDSAGVAAPVVPAAASDSVKRAAEAEAPLTPCVKAPRAESVAAAAAASVAPEESEIVPATKVEEPTEKAVEPVLGPLVVPLAAAAVQPSLAAEAAPTGAPAPAAPKPAGNMMMNWLKRSSTTGDATAASTSDAATPSGSPSSQTAAAAVAAAKPKGRPPLTEEQKAERAAARKAAKASTEGAAAGKKKAAGTGRQAAAAAAFGVKSSTIRMGSGDALVDDEDEEDDDAPIAAVLAPQAARRGRRGGAKDTTADPAEEFDAAAHDAQLYAEEAARIAAEMTAVGSSSQSLEVFALGEGLTTTPAPATASAVKPTAATTAKSSASGSNTPAKAAVRAKPSIAVCTAQPTLKAFAAAGAAISAFQSAHRREVRETVEKINGEFVSKDTVVYIVEATGEEISEAVYKQRLVELQQSAAAAPAVTTPPREPLQPREGGANVPATAAKAVKPAVEKAPAAKKATAAKSTTAPAGTRSLASFWGKAASA